MENSSSLPRNHDWIPTMWVEPGMVLARPVMGGSGGHGAIQLGAGARLTAATIAQLINKGIECVAVVQEVVPEPEIQAQRVAGYESRLHEIFGPEPDANCRPLLAALLADGAGSC